MTAAATAAPARRAQGGPPLLVPALAYAALMITAVILSASSPQPSASAAAVQAYNLTHHDALQVAGCLGFAAALPLAIWTATVYRRLRTSLGVTAPGPVIGLAGGLLAAASLALTGLVNWTSSQIPASGDPAAARALADLGFATGSAGFIAPLGLLIAGIAVPGLIQRLLPRPLAWAGLVIAAISELSVFALLTPALDFAFPAGRFLGLAWLITASITLPASRRSRRSPPWQERARLHLATKGALNRAICAGTADAHPQKSAVPSRHRSGPVRLHEMVPQQLLRRRKRALNHGRSCMAVHKRGHWRRAHIGNAGRPRA